MQLNEKIIMQDCVPLYAPGNKHAWIWIRLVNYLHVHLRVKWAPASLLEGKPEAWRCASAAVTTLRPVVPRPEMSANGCTPEGTGVIQNAHWQASSKTNPAHTIATCTF